LAASYDHVWAPLFTLIATDLVAMLALPASGRVLDVGTGTGVTLLPAAEAVGPRGLVVGLDPSVEMLRFAEKTGESPLVLGEVPGLPFAAGAFDAVLASFVVSHFTEYETALSDMVRVLQPEGQPGVTAWGPPRSSYGQVWQDVAESFVNGESLLEADREGVPWEQWFSDPVHLREALQNAGLVRLEVRSNEYQVVVRVADYLMAWEVSLKGRFMRQTLTPVEWKRFRTAVAEEFRTRFGESIAYIAQAHLAVGTKP
jgi:ubiquinone/menaquinone biosynthesis C-methylase UbiE